MVFEAVEFRKKKITSRREESQVEAQVLHLLERYLLVEEVLNLHSVEWHRPPEAPYPVMRDVSEADRAAQSLRDHWSLGIDPIPNVVELLEDQGIKVLAFDLTHIDGLTARVRRPGKDAVPVIVVNHQDWGERQRFTLAHELGHLVMEVSARVGEEKAAHRFAGAFLMPADALWAEIGKHRTSIGWGELFELKQLFGTSVQAITYRCKDLGIFSDTCSGGCSTILIISGGALRPTRSRMRGRERSRSVSSASRSGHWPKERFPRPRPRRCLKRRCVN